MKTREFTQPGMRNQTDDPLNFGKAGFGLLTYLLNVYFCAILCASSHLPMIFQRAFGDMQLRAPASRLHSTISLEAIKLILIHPR